MEVNWVERIEKVLEQHSDNQNLVFYKMKKMLLEAEGQDLHFTESQPVMEVLSDMLKNRSKEAMAEDVVETGFEFDAVSPFLKSELITIGGRPGSGKEILLSNLALRISQTKKTIYFSFRETQFNLALMFLAIKEKMSICVMRENIMNATFQSQVDEYSSSLCEHQLMIDSNSAKSIHAWFNHCETLIKNESPEVLIIDYVQLMGSMNRLNQRDLEIGYIMRKFKELAINHHICIILSSELNRSTDIRPGYKYPLLSDLRDSGSIESLSDKVILLYRPDYYGLDTFPNGNIGNNAIELNFAKNNFYTDTTTMLRIDMNTMQLMDYDNIGDEKEIDNKNELEDNQPNLESHQRKGDWVVGFKVPPERRNEVEF